MAYLVNIRKLNSLSFHSAASTTCYGRKPCHAAGMADAQRFQLMSKSRCNCAANPNILMLNLAPDSIK